MTYSVGTLVRYIGNGQTFDDSGKYIGIEGVPDKVYTITSHEGEDILPSTNAIEDLYELDNNDDYFYYHSSLKPIKPDNEACGSFQDLMSSLNKELVV